MTTELLDWQRDPNAPLPERVKGLIFDCDGTLVDTMPTHFIAWRKALEPFGLPLSEERFYAFAGMPTQKIIETLADEYQKKVDARKVAEQKEEAYYELIDQVKEIAAVVAIARRENGKRKLAVASGGWHRVVERSLETIGALDLFPVIVGADDVTHGKPNPDVFLRAAELLGLPPENCIVYEDGELGFQAALAAGMSVVDVRPWYGGK
jgi:beta-phosphoglucomutase family hydrolase